MKMELCSPDRLKVVLRCEELHEKRLTYERLDYDNALTRRVLHELLDQARRLIGFDSTHSRVMIEALPLLDGGCVLYFTLLARLSPRPSSGGAAVRLYAFSSSDALMDACARLWREKRETISQSASYRLGKNYLLALTCPAGEADAVNGIVGEYGRLFGKGAASARFAAEHGIALAPENAVERLGAV